MLPMAECSGGGGGGGGGGGDKHFDIFVISWQLSISEQTIDRALTIHTEL